MTIFRLLVLLAAAALLGGCATTGASRAIMPEQVVEMAKAGESADAIIKKLQDSGTVYRLSAAEVVRLHNDGVPDPVIDYMQSTYVDAVRWEESQRAYFYRPYPYWYYGRHYYPWWW
jgi:hypothetical protein